MPDPSSGPSGPLPLFDMLSFPFERFLLHLQHFYSYAAFGVSIKMLLKTLSVIFALNRIRNNG